MLHHTLFLIWITVAPSQTLASLLRIVPQRCLSPRPSWLLRGSAVCALNARVGNAYRVMCDPVRGVPSSAAPRRTAHEDRAQSRAERRSAAESQPRRAGQLSSYGVAHRCAALSPPGPSPCRQRWDAIEAPRWSQRSRAGATAMRGGTQRRDATQRTTEQTGHSGRRRCAKLGAHPLRSRSFVPAAPLSALTRACVHPAPRSRSLFAPAPSLLVARRPC